MMMYARPIRNLSRCWSFAGLLLFGVATSQQASAANPHDYDIRGMKLGQTVEEIKASMAKLIPGATVHEEFWIEEPGFEKATKILWVGVGGDLNLNNHGNKWLSISNMDEYIQVVFGQVSGQAYLITQSVRSKTIDKAVTFDNLVTKLIEKYGEPTSYGGSSKGNPRWVFKDNNERINDKNSCSPQIIYSLEESFLRKQSLYDLSGCGISLAAQIISGRPLVDSYAVSLIDYAAVLNDEKERDARKQEQERRREKEMIEQTQGNDPKL